MAEAAVWLAEKLAEYLVDPASQQLQYLFCVGKITRNVQMAKEELIMEEGRVQKRVQRAKIKAERIDDEVDKWMKDVKNLIAEVEELQKELSDNNGYLRGWFPTWKRYCLCEKLYEATKRMIDLNTKSQHFNPFSHRIMVSDIEYRSFENFIFFNSTQMAYDQLWKALQDDGTSMIGLWGMGGSGKTTLVKEVRRKAKELQLFDRVVLTTISQKPDRRKIQGEIADMLGIKFEEESETGRAERIALRLQNGERILIILDDVWAKLNLEDIGIPSGGNHQRGCKVVLTTRRLEVCNLMKCQQTVQLHLLKDDESWALFQTLANFNDAAREDVAREIAKECKGLPIAIVAVGTCLNGKGIDEMNVMLHSLRNAKAINADEGVRDAFTCLKLSYDYLATSEAKLLLMCAMFPEDHIINVDDIFRYGVGLGLFIDVDSFEIIRSKVRTTIYRLIDSSLLMRSLKVNWHGEECVRMHDVVRDFALWKASEENNTIMVNFTKELSELANDERVENCYAISSWYDIDNEVVQFPSQFDAPKLEILLLHSCRPLDVSHSTFEGIKRLKALIIMHKFYNDAIVQLQSIQHLSDLRTLRLENLALCDISFVVSLTKLEILDLRGSTFKRVPNGIKKLNKLKMLDLSYCRIDECCYEAIGRCLQLQELYVPGHYPHSGNTNCYEYLVDPTALRRLRRYNLEIGNCDEYLVFQNEGARSLHLGQLNMCMLGAIIKDLAQRAIAIEFYELKGKSFMPNIVQTVGVMNELTELRFRECPEVECLIDKTSMNNLNQVCLGPSPFRLFQKMEKLTIFDCRQLLHIFPVDCNLGNLKFLHISWCPKLTSVFSVSAACTLSSLEVLKIEHCDELKYVVEGEGGGDACDEQPMHDQHETQIVLPLLKYINLECLPRLVRICSEGYQPTWPSMKTVKLDECQNMEHLSRTESCLLKLEALEINYCNKLQFIFMISDATSMLPQLSSLIISDCSQLEEIFKSSNFEVHDINNEWKITFPNMERLELRELPRLVNFCRGFKWQTQTEKIWKYIQVHDCPKFMLFEIATMAWTSKSLERTYAMKYSQLNDNEALNLPISFLIAGELDSRSARVEHNWNIIGDDEEEEESDNSEMLSSEQQILGVVPTQVLSFQYLHSLYVTHIKKLKYLFSTRTILHYGLPILTSLTLSDCEELEEIIAEISSEDDSNYGERIELASLSKIELRNLPNFRSVCHHQKLEEIMSSSKKEHRIRNESSHCFCCFPRLRMFAATNCKKLKYLFSTSTILHYGLPILISLTLYDCEELEEIIAGISSEDDANYGETIVLSSLSEIELRNLPNFKSVCRGFQIRTQLRRIDIQNCPKFVDSSLRSALQQLGTLSVSAEDSNFQTTSRAESLSLRGSMNLISLWEGPNFILFQNLKWLLVYKCRRLKCIFPRNVIRSLPCLERLWIGDCEELEEIMSSEEEEQHIPNESSHRFCCFPQLRNLEVTNCKKLEWLFPSLPSTQLLPQLHTVSIKGCSQLKGFFNFEVEIYEDAFYNNLLPMLSLVWVDDCPTTLAALHRRKRKQTCTDPVIKRRKHA